MAVRRRFRSGWWCRTTLLATCSFLWILGLLTTQYSENSKIFLRRKLESASQIVNNFHLAHPVVCPDLTQMGFYPHGKHGLTALASYPGSGNSWTRGLIAQLTGINTGDIYGDVMYGSAPGFAKRKDDTVVAVKTHFPVWEGKHTDPAPLADNSMAWKRAILIIRHPLDAIRSFWCWQKTGSHTRPATYRAFLKHGQPKPQWLEYVQQQLANWLRFIQFWVIRFEGPVHIIIYENLKIDIGSELLGLRDFLTPFPADTNDREAQSGAVLETGMKNKRMNLTEKEASNSRLVCVVNNRNVKVDDKFKRTLHVDRKVIYDRKTVELADEILRRLDMLLIKHYKNYDSLQWPDYYRDTKVNFLSSKAAQLKSKSWYNI